MSIYLNKLKGYWSSLNDREKRLSLFAICSLGIYLFYILIYYPCVHSVINKNIKLQEQKKTLTFMQNTYASKNFNNHAKSLSNSELLSILTAKLQRSSFKEFSYQLQQTGNGEIKLSFEKVPFNAFINWLQIFSKEYLINIKEISFVRTEEAGLVVMQVMISI